MKYVYMIDYEYNFGVTDQVECYTQSEVITELKYLSLKNSYTKNIKIVNVKLVEDENREHEEDISYTFGQEVIQLLGYKPMYMNTRNKGERL